MKGIKTQRVYLKQARKKRKVTQEELGSILGISAQGYGHLERGTRGTREENWVRLYHFFNEEVPLDKLMLVENPMEGGDATSIMNGGDN